MRDQFHTRQCKIHGRAGYDSRTREIGTRVYTNLNRKACSLFDTRLALPERDMRPHVRLSARAYSAQAIGPRRKRMAVPPGCAHRKQTKTTERRTRARRTLRGFSEPDWELIPVYYRSTRHERNLQIRSLERHACIDVGPKYMW